MIDSGALMMGQLSITVNGRSYQIACEEGQEKHLGELGAYLDKRVKDLVAQVGQVGDTRLLVMVALLIADELSELYDELDTVRGQKPTPGAASIAIDMIPEAEMADRLEAAARTIEDIAARLERV
jgi:cell division protein ZapA